MPAPSATAALLPFPLLEAIEELAEAADLLLGEAVLFHQRLDQRRSGPFRELLAQVPEPLTQEFLPGDGGAEDVRHPALVARDVALRQEPVEKGQHGGVGPAPSLAAEHGVDLAD